MVGLSLRLETKSPGTNDIARNEMNVIPRMSGIMLSRRRIRKRVIVSWCLIFRRSLASGCSVGLELHPLLLVKAPDLGLIVLQRVLPRRITLPADRFEYRQLVVEDLLNFPVVLRALGEIHFGCALVEQRVDLRFPRRCGRGLIWIPDVQV